MNPFELVFTNILFFYPDFRPFDTARKNYPILLKTLHRELSGGELGKRGLMVYVHIPFCRHVCRFCGYHRRLLTNPDVLLSYLNRLTAEIQGWARILDSTRPRVSHIYFGGGTPTLLASADFIRLIEAIRKAFAVSEETQFEIESDLTALLDIRNLETYRAAGVKRISFGIQSFDEQVRRIAGIRQFRDGGYLDECLKNLRQAGYGVNYDLMFGLPGQSIESFLKDIGRSILNVGAEHLDLLEFFPQPEAYFTRKFEQFEPLTADRDTRRKMYSEARRYLLESGFAQQSLTDFWQDGSKPSRFKTIMYRNGDILGLGAGSHGILGDCAYRNARLDEGYLEELWDSSPLAFIRPLPPRLRRTRSLVLLPKLLRFSDADFPGGITGREQAILARFMEQGRLRREKDTYEVTEDGMLSSADMMLEILATEDP